MARKKQEIALQIEINSQEEWDENMKKEGLMVIDIYQEWCGPCRAVTNFFRRIKNEIGDDFLNFAVAKADTIDSLEKYRGRCEPCFLIYGGRALVGVVRGANPPVLETMIRLKLEEEHKVMKGEIERNETKDPYLAELETEEKVQELEKDEGIEREITLALIKPDAVKSGQVEDIIKRLQDAGIEILAQQERNLTVDEAKEFYHHMNETEFFEDLIKFITSGPSRILVLAKGDEGIIREFRELIGPKVLDEAKETAPNSIRAIYGTNSIENAIHGADDRETAQRELAFFFPDFMIPKVATKKHEESNVQRTLALIRPAAYMEYRDNIIEKINNAGFKITMQKEVQLTKEDAALFYKQHKEKPFFEELITEMSKGALLALALEKQNAVIGWRGMLGPKDVEKAKETDPNSLRAQFSKDDIKINLLHGSDSDETAEVELKYFFPVEQTIAVIKPDGMENEEEIINRIHEARFKIVKSKKISMDKQLAEEFYSDQKEADYFNELIAHMQSGPSLFMVLSREDAIRGWRSVIGPKDSRVANDTYPDSIRAIFGEDIKKNAVYGSDNVSEVQRVMNLIFGPLGFNEDGTLLPEFEDQPEEQKDTEEKAVEGESQADQVDSEPSDTKPPATEDTVSKEIQNDQVDQDQPPAESEPEISEDKKTEETQNQSGGLENDQSKTIDDTKTDEKEIEKPEESNLQSAENQEGTTDGQTIEETKETEQSVELDHSQQKSDLEENENTLAEDQTMSETKEDRISSADNDDSKNKDSSDLTKTDAEASKAEESKSIDKDSEENREEPSTVEESKAEESQIDESQAEESKAEESKAEESKAEESKIEESKTEESKVEESKADDSRLEESKAEESKTEESQVIFEKKVMEDTEVTEGTDNVANESENPDQTELENNTESEQDKTAEENIGDANIENNEGTVPESDAT